RKQSTNSKLTAKKSGSEECLVSRHDAETMSRLLRSLEFLSRTLEPRWIAPALEQGGLRVRKTLCFPLFCSCNMHGSYDEPGEPVISTDDEEAIAPEEERRDPEDECVTMPIQGFVAAVGIPGTALRGHCLKNVSSKLVVGPSRP